MGRAAERVQQLADAARHAGSAAREADAAHWQAQGFLNHAFWSLAREHRRYHRAVIVARYKLDHASRQAGWFLGRRAVRAAKRRLRVAENRLRERQVAVQYLSEELADRLERFVEAGERQYQCDLKYRDAQVEADKGYDAVPFPSYNDRLGRISYLSDRQEGLCGICGESIIGFPPDELHVDHIQPRSKGGSDEPSNLQLAHATCNIRKGTTWPWPPDDFDPDNYFTPEIREILAQRAMGYADADPTPVPPGRPNRDTAATYEEAKREHL